MGVRHVLGGLVLQVSSAISNAMLGTVGLASFVILFKRRTLAIAAAILCFTPVAVSGMFNPGYPTLALALGAAMIAIFVFVIVRVGLLGGIAALAIHFILLRAPLTTHLSTWWGPIGLWYLATVAAIGFGACYIARASTVAQPARRYSLQGA
jgi:hypothetical protein